MPTIVKLLMLSFVAVVIVSCSSVTPKPEAAAVIRMEDVYPLNPAFLDKVDMELAWSAKGQKTDLVSVSVLQDVIAVEMTDNYVYAYDNKTGAFKWALYMFGELNAPLSEDDENIYATSKSTLHIISKETGQRTQVKLDFAPSTAVEVDMQRLYIGEYSGRLQALRKEDFAPVWSHTTNGLTYSKPYSNGARVFIGCGDGTIYVVDSADGSDVWSYKGEDEISTDIVPFGLERKETEAQPSGAEETVTLLGTGAPQRVVVGSIDQYIYSIVPTFTTEAGQSVQIQQLDWKFNTGGQVLENPVALGKKIYVNPLNNGVMCLNETDGRQLWHLPGGTRFLAKDNDTVYLSGRNGLELWTVDDTTGTIEWKMDLKDFPDAATNPMSGYIYLVSPKGDIFALKAKAQ